MGRPKKNTVVSTDVEILTTQLSQLREEYSNLVAEFDAYKKQKWDEMNALDNPIRVLENKLKVAVDKYKEYEARIAQVMLKNKVLVAQLDKRNRLLRAK